MQFRGQIVIMCAFASAIALVTLAVLNFSPAFVAPIVALACGLSSWMILSLRSSPCEDVRRGGRFAGEDS